MPQLPLLVQENIVTHKAQTHVDAQTQHKLRVVALIAIGPSVLTEALKIAGRYRVTYDQCGF